MFTNLYFIHNTSMSQLSHITFSHWSILESCNMAILTVNGSDNTVCASKFLQAVQMRKDIMVFCAHRGLRNSSRLNDRYTYLLMFTFDVCIITCIFVVLMIAYLSIILVFTLIIYYFIYSLSGKSHITSLECVVGFAVTQNPRTLAYAASTTTPCMAMPRFSEEVNRVAEGPVNLLEAVNIHILYRKTLTGNTFIYYDILY